MLLMLIETDEERRTFARLYEELYRPLIYVARRILSDPARAEDAVHEIFLVWAGDYPKYKHKTKTDMLRLGITMTKNKCFNILSAQKRHHEVTLEDEDTIADTRGDLLEGVIAGDELSRLMEAIKTLPEKDQTMLAFRYDQDLSYREIGRITGLTEKNVEMRLYRIRKKLKEVLSE
ncbi:MAG: RNA polymerase sigma factor [Eubacterium sp.]|nr:RNA polymerase sigma factor [Eubacterium sp.]